MRRAVADLDQIAQRQGVDLFAVRKIMKSPVLYGEQQFGRARFPRFRIRFADVYDVSDGQRVHAFRQRADRGMIPGNNATVFADRIIFTVCEGQQNARRRCGKAEHFIQAEPLDLFVYRFGKPAERHIQ